MYKVKLVLLGAVVSLFAVASDLGVTVVVNIGNSTGVTKKADAVKKVKRVFPKYKKVAELIKAYSDAWKLEDYILMYNLLSSELKEEWNFVKFKKLAKEDKSSNGGVSKFTDLKEKKKNEDSLKIVLTIDYKNASARDKTVRTELIKEKDHWFIGEGGLLPPDLSPFDR